MNITRRENKVIDYLILSRRAALLREAWKAQIDEYYPVCRPDRNRRGREYGKSVYSMSNVEKDILNRRIGALMDRGDELTIMPVQKASGKIDGNAYINYGCLTTTQCDRCTNRASRYSLHVRNVSHCVSETVTLFLGNAVMECFLVLYFIYLKDVLAHADVRDTYVGNGIVSYPILVCDTCGRPKISYRIVISPLFDVHRPY